MSGWLRQTGYLLKRSICKLKSEEKHKAVASLNSENGGAKK